jgi:large subunit ribosomal protein L25
MEFQKLNAEVRTGRKKGAARRLRRDGRIPAVCYGPDQKSALVLALDPKALRTAMSSTLGRNAVIELTVTGASAPPAPMLVMLQDAQYHPVARTLLHADFLTVAHDREVRVEVPLVLQGRALGVQAGGVISQVLRDLPVRCPLDAIPSELVLDVSNVELGGIMKVSDLALPENVVVELEPNRTLVSVVTPKIVETVAEEGVEGEEAAAAPAEGEEPAEAEKPEAEE